MLFQVVEAETAPAKGKQLRVLGKTDLDAALHVPHAKFSARFARAHTLESLDELRVDPLKPPPEGASSPWLTCGLQDTVRVHVLSSLLLGLQDAMGGKEPGKTRLRLTRSDLILLEYAWLVTTVSRQFVYNDIASAAMMDSNFVTSTETAGRDYLDNLLRHCKLEDMKCAALIYDNGMRLYNAFEPFLPLLRKSSDLLDDRFKWLSRPLRFSCYTGEGAKDAMPMVATNPSKNIVLWCEFVSPPAWIDIHVTIQPEEQKDASADLPPKPVVVMEMTRSTGMPPPPPPPKDEDEEVSLPLPPPAKQKSKKRKREEEDAPAESNIEEPADAPKDKKRKDKKRRIETKEEEKAATSVTKGKDSGNAFCTSVNVMMEDKSFLFLLTPAFLEIGANSIEFFQNGQLLELLRRHGMKSPPQSVRDVRLFHDLRYLPADSDAATKATMDSLQGNEVFSAALMIAFAFLGLFIVPELPQQSAPVSEYEARFGENEMAARLLEYITTTSPRNLKGNVRSNLRKPMKKVMKALGLTEETLKEKTKTPTSFSYHPKRPSKNQITANEVQIGKLFGIFFNPAMGKWYHNFRSEHSPLLYGYRAPRPSSYKVGVLFTSFVEMARQHMSELGAAAQEVNRLHVLICLQHIVCACFTKHDSNPPTGRASLSDYLYDIHKSSPSSSK